MGSSPVAVTQTSDFAPVSSKHYAKKNEAHTKNDPQMKKTCIKSAN